MKAELLFHVHEHDGFISSSTQRKYTEGSVFKTIPPLHSMLRKRWSDSWFVGICVCEDVDAYVHACVCLHAISL